MPPWVFHRRHLRLPPQRDLFPKRRDLRRDASLTGAGVPNIVFFDNWNDPYGFAAPSSFTTFSDWIYVANYFNLRNSHTWVRAKL